MIYTLLDRRVFVPSAAFETSPGEGGPAGTVGEAETSSATPGPGLLPQPALGNALKTPFEEGIVPGPAGALPTGQEL